MSSRGHEHRLDPVYSERAFEQLVSAALDELPSDVLDRLDGVAVIVCERGAQEHAYGEYRGIGLKHRSTTWSAPAAPDRILIFRDTLIRDFGHDPELLRANVRQTVRHEVGHYLGFDEEGVRRLGL